MHLIWICGVGQYVGQPYTFGQKYTSTNLLTKLIYDKSLIYNLQTKTMKIEIFVFLTFLDNNFQFF